MAEVERTLQQTAKIPANAGHPLHKGTPREAFVRQFLQDHLSESLAIGQGEVIAANSKPRQPRNQFDIVLYKKQFPKLHLGGGVNAFLVESVAATIEVKSLLTKKELRKAVLAARAVKRLPRTASPMAWLGHPPPSCLCYVIAYQGPAKVGTIAKWLEEIHREEGIAVPELPTDTTQRYRIASPSLDGVFLLSQGFVHFDNLPIGFVTNEQRARKAVHYYIGKTTDGTLLVFFLFLTHYMSGLITHTADLVAYLTGFKIRVFV